MENQFKRKSPVLNYAHAPQHSLFERELLRRPRIMSDMELTVSRAFGVDNFSLMPIDKPLGKLFYLGPTFIFSFLIDNSCCLLE